MRKLIVAVLALMIISSVGVGVFAQRSTDTANGTLTIDVTGSTSSLAWNAVNNSVSGFSDPEIDQGYAQFLNVGNLVARSVNPYYVVSNISVSCSGCGDGGSVRDRLKVKTQHLQGPDLQVTGGIKGTNPAPQPAGHDNQGALMENGTGALSGMGYLDQDGHNPSIMSNQCGTGGNGNPDQAQVDFAIDLSHGEPTDPDLFGDYTYTVSLNFTLTAP